MIDHSLQSQGWLIYLLWTKKEKSLDFIQPKEGKMKTKTTGGQMWGVVSKGCYTIGREARRGPWRPRMWKWWWHQRLLLKPSLLPPHLALLQQWYEESLWKRQPHSMLSGAHLQRMRPHHFHSVSALSGSTCLCLAERTSRKRLSDREKPGPTFSFAVAWQKLDRKLRTALTLCRSPVFCQIG